MCESFSMDIHTVNDERWWSRQNELISNCALQAINDEMKISPHSTHKTSGYE